MTEEILGFIQYMKEVRKTSENTSVSYERDLRKMNQYFADQGIEKADQITITGLNSYILFLAPSLQLIYSICKFTSEILSDINSETRIPVA